MSFDPMLPAWTPTTPSVNGTVPSPRIGSGFASLGTKLYLFGGFNGEGFVFAIICNYFCFCNYYLGLPILALRKIKVH